jgi:hypothetical protein
MKTRVRVIGLNPSFEVENFKTDIVYKDGKNLINYYGFDYEINRNKIYHMKKDYVVFLNATIGGVMEHKLVDELIRIKASIDKSKEK